MNSLKHATGKQIYFEIALKRRTHYLVSSKYFLAETSQCLKRLANDQKANEN